MLRRLNRQFKAFMRKKRIEVSRAIWDKWNGNTPLTDNDLIVDHNIRSILFIRADGKIGDMIISTFMFREIKEIFVGIKIGVVTKGGAKDIIEDDPYIDKIYDYGNSLRSIRKLAHEIKKEKYDLVMEFYEEIKPKELMFICLCGARFNMGLNKKNWPLFNLSVDGDKDFQMNEHISFRYIAFLEKLGIKKELIDTSYGIFFDADRAEKIKQLRKKYNSGKTVILNPYGASKHRSFNRDTIKKILNGSNDHKVILLYNGKEKYQEVKEIAAEYKNVDVPDGIETIMDSAMYIRISDLVISPDTSIIHLAAAFNIDIIGVYEYNGGTLGHGHIVWGPHRDNAVLIFARQRTSTYDDFDLNNFDFDELRKKLEEK